MTEPLMAHLKWVDSVVIRTERRNAFTFGMACTERQWAVLERATRQRCKQAALPAVRQALDAVWTWLKSEGFAVGEEEPRRRRCRHARASSFRAKVRVAMQLWPFFAPWAMAWPTSWKRSKKTTRPMRASPLREISSCSN